MEFDAAKYRGLGSRPQRVSLLILKTIILYLTNHDSLQRDQLFRRKETCIMRERFYLLKRIFED